MTATSSGEDRVAQVARRTAAGTVLRLVGRVDEAWVAPKLDDPGSALIIDMREVDQFTSGGVRRWMKFVSELRVPYLAFTNCRPNALTQFNSVARFGGSGELISFYLPIVCTACGELAEQFVDLRREYQQIHRFEVPTESCVKCQADCELDEEPTSLLYYPAHSKAPAPPPSALALINGDAPAGNLQFRAAKEVHEAFTALWLIGSLTPVIKLRRLADGLDGEVLLIFHDVEAKERASLERLRPLLEVKGASVLLARLPEAIARQLLAREGGLGPGWVVSLMMEGTCSACPNAGALEVSLEPTASGRVPARCMACGTEQALPLSAAQRALYEQVPRRAVSEAARAYLTAHRVPPAAEAVLRNGSNETGKYTSFAPLGRGGMAQVFLANQVGVGGFEKRVVLKRILPHLSSDAMFVEQFLSEARLAARINHPNVVAIFEVDRDAEGYFIAMEYVEGSDLWRLLKDCKARSVSLPLSLVLRIAADICAGLEGAHSVLGPDGKPTPIFHRDISPQNVLLSNLGLAKVSDFGIAKIGTSSETLTPSNVIKGKLSYTAPELLGGQPASAQTDIFAAGVVLYQMVTLKHPYQRDTELRTLRAIIEVEPPPVTMLRLDAPKELGDIVAKAMAVRPEDRYASAGEMAHDLELMLRSQDSNGKAELAAWVRGLPQETSPKVSSSMVETVGGADTITPLISPR